MKLSRTWLTLATLTLCAPLLGACGGEETAAEEPVLKATNVAIKADGVYPSRIVVSSSARVRFVNEDRVPHRIASEPHPDHTDCPELNGPTLEPRAGLTVTMFEAGRVCRFHDHLHPDDVAYQGVIEVK